VRVCKTVAERRQVFANPAANKSFGSFEAFGAFETPFARPIWKFVESRK
jgi:hypothetical protein